MHLDSAHQLDWMFSVSHLVFEIIKVTAAPFITFFLLAFLHEPYRMARAKYETYLSWLVVFPSEIKRLRIEASSLVEALSTPSMTAPLTLTLSNEFLMAARVPIMSHPRAQHIIPLVNETISHLTEAMQHISRYNERVGKWTADGGVKPLTTLSILNLKQSLNALQGLERKVQEELELAPSHKPPFLRYWSQTDSY